MMTVPKQQVIGYDLSKKVPQMYYGFSIDTPYGPINIDEEDAKPFADMVERLLTKKLKALEGGANHGRR